MIKSIFTKLKALRTENNANCSNPLAQNNTVQTTEKEIEPKEPAKVDASTVLSQLYNIKPKSNRFIIQPKEFPSTNKKAPNIFATYPEEKAYPHYDLKFRRFDKNAKAIELKKQKPDERIIYVSNFDEPTGTIAGSSTLDKTLYTDELIECAALAVVDKAHNTQSLIHVFPGYSVDTNKQIINHILKASKPEDLELSIVPGRSIRTTQTVQFILDTVKEYSDDIDVKLYNYPTEDLKIEERGLLLKNGELSCCSSSDVIKKDTNPKENITFATPIRIACATDEEIKEALAKIDLDQTYDYKKLIDWADENELKIRFYNMKTTAEFLDNDNKVIRTVRAGFPDMSKIEKETRTFYDEDGMEIANIYRFKDGSVECEYDYDTSHGYTVKKAILGEDNCWYSSRFGKLTKLPNNPLTGKPQ